MSYRLRYHPAVARDLATILALISDYSGPAIAERKLSEIERTLWALQQAPHRGTIRNEIVPGLRAIPAARRAVIAFSIEETPREVFVIAVTYGGADWAARVRARPER